ncbi:hypothetical protein DSOL_0062 [Desulfosporosinus metallidurans]|uniref:Uncharacterized protein n=1 Tax=Desulfosporosinus metallidurans TaxID=1888891 RepID=A0A1Q8R2S7_9FIRM|nr:hypothetical protein DSOL_0062 [Desulfosporosinus metallidurans]
MRAGGVPTKFGILASVGGFEHPCAQPRFGGKRLSQVWRATQ